MNFSKRGKNNSNDNFSQGQSQQEDDYSNSSRPRKIQASVVSGRSPQNSNNRRYDVDRNTQDSGPEIQFIDNDMDRRNPMMDMNRGYSTNQIKQDPNSRSSIITNIKQDVENPSYRERFEGQGQRTREARKKNQRTNENSESESSYVSQGRRNQNPSSQNSIVKKMSPNRNTDMNMDSQVSNSGNNESNKRQFVRKLSIIADKNKPKEQKNEFSVDTHTRENIKKTYNNDLDAIKKMDFKQNNFKMNNNFLVNKGSNEGNLYNTRSMQLSATMTPSQIEDQKKNIKNLNKLSTVLIKDNKTRDPLKEKTIRNNYKEYTEKTLRNSGSPKKRNIRSTMSMLSSRGPNADDKIITRQMRFEKGGVVDLAMNPSSSRSPKKAEIKKHGLRSPKTVGGRDNRQTKMEKEKSAQIVQAWWRATLSKFKEVEEKTITIQKNWRRFFVRKHLYDKLSYYYYFVFVVDKLEKLFRNNDLNFGFSKLYNLNAKEYNAVKYLSKVILIQRAFRFFKKRAQDRKKQLKIIGIKQLEPRRRRVDGDDSDQDNKGETIIGANKPQARHRRRRVDTEDDEDLIGSNQNNKNLQNKYEELKKSNFRNVCMNLFFKVNNRNVHYFMTVWRKRALLMKNGQNNEDLLKGLAREVKNYCNGKLLKNFGLFLRNLQKRSNDVLLRNQSNSLSRNTSSNSKNDDGINKEKFNKVMGANAKNIFKKIINRKLFNAFNKWVRSTLNNRQKKLQPLLQKLLNRKNLNLKFYNLTHFFNHWRNFAKSDKLDDKLDNFRHAVMGKFLKNFVNRKNNKKLLKRFLQWANLAKQGRTNEQNDSINEIKNKQLSAASHLVPLLANICKKSIARKHGDNLINILRNKNKGGNLKKFVDKIPFFDRYNLKKYFDKFRLRLAEGSGADLKNKIVRDMIKKYLNKNVNGLLKKKFRLWYGQLSQNVENKPVDKLNAVDELKRCLQKRYIKYPVDLFKKKVQDGNYDWAARFALTMKRKVLKGTIREYINRWRNNQLDALVRDNMKKFYSTTLFRFSKRFVNNILRKRFNQWKNQNQLVGNANRNANIIKFVRNVDYYLNQNSMEDKKKLLEELGQKKKNKKYGVALDIMTGIYFSNDRKKIGEYFRKWRVDTIIRNLEIMRYRLLSKIMNRMVGKNDMMNFKDRLQKYFDRWKKEYDRKNKSIRNLNQFMDRVFHSALFHKQYVRNYLDDILEFAKHYNLLNKKKAQKLGDFLAGILKIFTRIKLMKRQRALIQTFKKFNFLDRMLIMTGINKWKNRTSNIANSEHATILQDFIRKITNSQNNKEMINQKAKNSMDNFAKRFALNKLSETAKLNRIYKILVSLFDSIPKELRKKALMNACIRWNRTADEIKKNNAANMIIKCLKGYITRRFAYKLLLKKYKREDIARRMFRFLVGQKLFYYSEWKRRARLLELKQNSSAMGIWMSKKFNGFKLLKSRRGLGELFQKYLNRKMIDALLAASKVDPHREQKLVDTINKIYLHPPARKVLKNIKMKFFKKKYGQVFGLLTRKLRHLHVYYYADYWRNKVMDEYYARLIRLQSWIRMVLARIKAKRELRKKQLTTKFFRKLGIDGNMAIMMYVNIWRSYCKYAALNQEGEILSKLILFHNANVDYDKDVAQNNLQKIFKGYFIKNVKDAFIDARNYKDSVVDIIKNLNANIEKHYAVNNLVDYGKDSVRRMMLQMVFGVQDKLGDHSKLRQAIERWRFYNAKLIEFVIKIQKIWRGRKIREKMKKLWRVKDIMIRMLIDNFSDKDQVRARTIVWRNRAMNLAITHRSTIIQNFLKNSMGANANKNLFRIFNNGYRKHFVKCIGNLMRFKKLKEAMSHPWNRQSMDVITKKAKDNKLRERFRVIMGFSDANNRDWIIMEMLKKWNLRAQRIKEHEMFSALLIVASIRSKLTKIKVQRFKELKSNMRMLLFKAFGDQNSMKVFAITQWLNYTRQRMLIESRDTIKDHAKDILRKIRENKDADRKAKFANAQDLIRKYIGKILLRGHFGMGLENIRNGKLRDLDDIYRNIYFRNLKEGFNRINWFGHYKDNLIRKIQRRWRFYRQFQNLLKKIMIARKIVKLALDGDLQSKNSHILFWRKQVHVMNTQRKGTTLQDFYRDIMDHLRKKKHSSIHGLGDLFKKNILNHHLLGPLKELNKWNKMADIENIFKKSHLRFLNRKTLLLYVLRLILGFYNKCENKVKQSAMYKFRFNALHNRDLAAKGLVFRCLLEIRNRRRENKIRELMVKLVKGRSISDKEIRDKFYADWSRKAEEIKAKEKVDIIGDYLKKQKRKLELKRIWMKLGQKMAAHNGIFGTRYILDQADKLRRIDPFVRIIYRRNYALNGDDFLNRLRNDNILKLLKRSFAPLMGEKDIYSIILHAKHWNSQAQKLLRRDQLLIRLGDHLQDNFNNRAFKLMRNACIFKYHCNLAEIVQKHNVLSKLKGESDHVENIQGFANSLARAQAKIFDNSSQLFRQNLYKFYVYKILMNMGSIFNKQLNYNFKNTFAKDFFNKFNLQFAPYKSHAKNLVDKLGPIIDGHNKTIKNRIFNILGFLKLENAAKKNAGRNIFDKFHHTWIESSKKGKLYVILRHGYLKKQLSIFTKANQFLIFTYISQLYTKNIIAKKIKKISKGFKQWRFKNQNIKITLEKTQSINASMEKFSKAIKEELLTGEHGLIREFAKYQNTDVVKPNLIKRFKNDTGKKFYDQLNERSATLKSQRTMARHHTESDEDDNNNNDFNDAGRSTMVQAKNAKNNMRK